MCLGGVWTRIACGVISWGTNTETVSQNDKKFNVRTPAKHWLFISAPCKKRLYIKIDADILCHCQRTWILLLCNDQWGMFRRTIQLNRGLGSNFNSSFMHQVNNKVPCASVVTIASFRVCFREWLLTCLWYLDFKNQQHGNSQKTQLKAPEL